MSPEKPDALLWMDVETTGLDANMCSILEIGLRCTSMDATREHARLEAVVHISRETMLSAQLPALDLHLSNGLLAQCETSDPVHCSPEAIAREATRFIGDMAGMYTLHPAGTNIQHFDLPMILRFCAKARVFDSSPIDSLLSYRALDVTTLRLTAKTLGQDPYTHRAKPTHRVHDCLNRDIAEYRHYLTLMTGPALAEKEDRP
jgi:oligoribonuclease|nr:MAG TPA: Orn [Caudoviricetes sp.]